MRVRWAPRAARDLDDIGEHIADHSPIAAERITQLVVAKASQLSEYPFAGRPGRAADTRELVVTGTPFIVVYRLRSDHVDIVAVMHGARDWPRAF